jgi:hypothetical protein
LRTPPAPSCCSSSSALAHLPASSWSKTPQHSWQSPPCAGGSSSSGNSADTCRTVSDVHCRMRRGASAQLANFFLCKRQQRQRHQQTYAAASVTCIVASSWSRMPQHSWQSPPCTGGGSSNSADTCSTVSDAHCRVVMLGWRVLNT